MSGRYSKSFADLTDGLSLSEQNVCFPCCCCSAVSPRNQPARNLNSSTSGHEITENVSKRNHEPLRKYIGCWSSYKGKWLILEKGELKTSVNSFEPVRFEVLDDFTESQSVVLKLPDRPQSYYFRKIVKLELSVNESDETELTISNFDSLEQLKQDDSLGVGSWVRSRCKVEGFDKSRIGEIGGVDDPS